ncbi:MAG TPA: dihydroneopterin aldolase [Fibrobacteria bacterium]|nr:dihydroneopterin aldolase [Fibrobacteria bacterium]
MGTLSIRELRISCIVGVYPDERKREQDLFVDVDMGFDFSRVTASDQLADTVDYTEVAADLADYVRAERFQIIETLAQRACARILTRHPMLKRCRLVIRKPAAVPHARGAVVTVEQERA